MHALVTIAAMIAIFAAHVLMMVELRPRGGEAKDKTTEAKLGETL
ncbi:MAG TPA: hypothetical protein VID67_11460 [Rhizomicrobium sp.]|jgi:hypothetical protein